MSLRLLLKKATHAQLASSLTDHRFTNSCALTGCSDLPWGFYTSLQPRTGITWGKGLTEGKGDASLLHAGHKDRVWKIISAAVKKLFFTDLWELSTCTAKLEWSMVKVCSISCDVLNESLITTYIQHIATQHLNLFCLMHPHIRPSVTQQYTKAPSLRLLWLIADYS